MNQTFFIAVFALCFFALLPQNSEANAITTQQAKTEHMRACLSKGDKKNICTCSFERSLRELGADNLINVNRALANNIPANNQHLDVLAKTTSKCAKDIAEGTYTANQTASTNLVPAPAALPVQSFNDLDSLTIPAPPALQKSTPDFSEDAGYFEDFEIDEEAERLAAEEQARAAQNKYGVKKLTDIYKGQYDAEFFKAAKIGDVVALKAIKQYLPTVNIVDSVGNTPLIEAAAAGQNAAISFLISHNGDVNLRNNEGQQAIHAAVFNGHAGTVSLLLEKKADVNSEYGNGFTPLNLAIIKRSAQMVQNLIIAGAQPSKAMGDGNLPIHIATTANSPEIISILHNYGADLNAENGQGYTPLMIASSQNKTASASALLALGTDFNKIDIYGRTAVQIAATLGHQQIVNLILTAQEQRSNNY